MKLYLHFLPYLLATGLFAQTNSYTISFENAVHHEAVVSVNFPNVVSDTLEVRMSRSSPGRYALHEFAKNIYDFKAMDGNGNLLKVFRKDPYSWFVFDHNGTVNISYTLFANRGDGTYSQVDETHAHLNIPATFMYAPLLSDRKIEVDFKVRDDLGWKVATQLPLISGTKFTAPNLQYFMDSPTEISNFGLREFTVNKQNIRLALHHNGTQEELDTYFEKVKKVVLEQQKVYGELPNFDYGTYTFLACYIPNASGDGMEHRNSTILTSTRSLAGGGMERNIGTVSHELFHAWNVERIRPKSLEPFNFTEANMSGSLWFAEGFTSYYTNLMLCRAGLMTPTEYVEGLSGTFNYVWNSPARTLFNPIEMSNQAPFVDASSSIDPVNRENTFISYYSYGSALGLALDLSLRQEGLTLDDYMKLVWKTYGKTEIPYTIEDLHNTLGIYAGTTFADTFFGNYIYQSQMPNYKKLFAHVGVALTQNTEIPFLGASVEAANDGRGIIGSNPLKNSPAYEAKLTKGDVITHINSQPLPKKQKFIDSLKNFKVGETITLKFERYGQNLSTTTILKANPNYTINLIEKTAVMPSKKVLMQRSQWLGLE